MEETFERRLVDEARREPVRNSLRLGWEFFTQNTKLAAVVLGVAVGLQLLSTIPLIGLVAVVAFSVVGQGIQIYAGRHFYASKDIVEFVEGVKGIPPVAFMTRYKEQAFGAWLGWFLVSMIFMVVAAVLFFAMGGGAEIHADMTDEEALNVMMTMSGAFLPMVFVGLLLSYVYPLVQGRIIFSESFGEAFRAVFSLFSPALWRRAMSGEYFRFVLWFGLVLTGFAVAVMAAASVLMLIPLLGWILVIVGTMLLYYVAAMVFSIAEVLALEMVEHPAD